MAVPLPFDSVGIVIAKYNALQGRFVHAVQFIDGIDSPEAKDYIVKVMGYK